MKLHRRTSKRVPLARKYNLQKKVSEHHKKVRKEASRLKKSGVVKSKKRSAGPGIPNNWPFKREELAEMERLKDLNESEKRNARMRKKKGLAEPQYTKETTVKDFDQLRAEAQERARQFDLRNNATAILQQSISRDASQESLEVVQTRKKFYDDLQKVIQAADVIIEVLDARDPQSCRCKKVEDEIKSSNKRLVFVLNKIDLVPAEAASLWLEELRKEAPTIAFKASRTGAGKAARKKQVCLGPNMGNESVLQSSSAAVGADKLMQLVKNYSRNDSGTGALSVGIIGYPNVGKSSVINTLLGLRRGGSGFVKTGAFAGVTRNMQEVNLDNKITLIDTAGVVFDSSVNDDASLVLRKAINVDSLRDPAGTLTRLIDTKIPPESLCQLMRVPSFSSSSEFLVSVATVHGKLRKGGGADIEAAARFVLNRISEGKIEFFCLPQKGDRKPVGGSFAKQVSESLPEMDIDALLNNNANDKMDVSA